MGKGSFIGVLEDVAFFDHFHNYTVCRFTPLRSFSYESFHCVDFSFANALRPRVSMCREISLLKFQSLV